MPCAKHRDPVSDHVDPREAPWHLAGAADDALRVLRVDPEDDARPPSEAVAGPGGYPDDPCARTG